MIAIVKPIGNFCNLRCVYCLYNGSDQNAGSIMSDKILEKLIVNLVEIGGKRVSIIWHGGEPMLAGLEFYRRAVSIQKRFPEVEFDNRLQTNATLINEEWIRFFTENKFGVGISLDGNKSSQDIQRFGVGHTPTFDRIRKNIQLMQSSGMKFGLIQTVTTRTLSHFAMDQEFFHKELGLKSWNVNFVDEQSGTDKLKTSEVSLAETSLMTMYEQLISFWCSSDDPNLVIDELDNYVAAVLNRRPRCCHFNGTCGSFCCIDYDGKVYPCDRMCSNERDIIGDLNTNDLISILTGADMCSFRATARVLHEDCLSCVWKAYCNNGCTAMRDARGKYRHCTVRKKVFELVSSIVSETSSTKETIC